MQHRPLELQPITDRINTGTDNPDNSRALVVFNLTEQAVSGTAVFRASMSWPRAVPLPPVMVTDFDGSPVPSLLRDRTDGPDAKGRADRAQLSFAIHFAVSDVPANGWRTYLASYTDISSPPDNTLGDNTLGDNTLGETPGLMVIETTRHGGDLPPVGDLLNPAAGDVNEVQSSD